jgi:enoyl-CoA hydratase
MPDSAAPTEHPGRADYQFIEYQSLDEGSIVRITLNRPKQRNAQNRGLLVELDTAFRRAEQDDSVRVIILAGAGTSFSAGHDLGSSADLLEKHPGPSQHISYQCDGGTLRGAEGRTRQEWHYYYDNTRRWRDLRKITIAEVQGNVFSAGLMLMWACDLIVSSDDAVFADVVGTRLGMCGVEYFAHPWEFGPRLSKEMLLTGDYLTAADAHRLGMVNKVFPAADLAEKTLQFARRVARVPTMAGLLIKDSVNQSVDAMGFSSALDACFTIHQLNHAHWSEVSKGEVYIGTADYGLDDWRDAPPMRRVEMDQP